MSLLELFSRLDEGVAFFDAEDRLCMYNATWHAELEALCGVPIRAGITFETLLRGLVDARGLPRVAWPGASGANGQATTPALHSTESFIDWRLALHRDASTDLHLAYEQDRVLQIIEHRVPGGGTLLHTARPHFDGRDESRELHEAGRDVTEQNDSEQIRRQFMDAIQTMTCGYAMFDRNDQLVIWNDIWLQQLCAEVRALVQQGASFDSLIQAIARHGDCVEARGRERDWCQQRLRLHQEPGPPLELQRGNGRWYRVQEHRTAAGETLVTSFDISEEREREQALRSSELRFKAFAEAASDWFWETDAELRFRYVSDGFYTKSGLSAAELLGRTGAEVFGPADPENPALWQAHEQLLRRHEAFRDFVFVGLNRSGERQHYRISGQPYYDTDGRFAGYRGSSTDITVEVEARATEERFVEALESMSEGYAMFDADDRLVLWNEQWVGAHHPRMRGVVQPGMSFEQFARRMSELLLEAGLIDDVEAWVQGRVWEHAHPGEPRERQFIDGEWYRVYERKTGSGGTLLLSSNVTDLKRRELELERSEARFKDYADAASDWFWESDAEHRLVYISARFTQLTGMPREGFIGHTRSEANPDGTDVETWTRHWQDLQSHRPFRGMEYAVNYNGVRHWMRVAGQPHFTPDGAFAGYRGTGMLITGEVTARQLEERFFDAIETVSDGYALFDQEDRLVLCNTTFREEICASLLDAQDTDITFAELLRILVDKGTFPAAVDPEEFYVERLYRHQNPGEPFTVERRGEAGEPNWYRVRERRTPEGGILLVASDITELKRQERALQESEARFKQFAETAADWFFETDAELRLSYVSERLGELTGLTAEQLIGKPMKALVDTLDHDKLAVQRMHSRMRARSAFENVEFRGTRTGDLPEVVHSLSGRTITSSSGEFLGYRGSGRDVTNSRRMARQLAYQARHDALTGLVNRTEFERRVTRAISTARSDSCEHALCYLDLDQFKVVNDSCGHMAGDEMLRQLSNVLRGKLRSQDTLARLGGDEFGILLEHCPQEQASRVANVLRRAIESFRFAWEDKSFRAGASIGLVPITAASLSVSEIMRTADTACYIAKDKGRNRVHFYRPDDEEQATREGELQWVARINDALENDRFALYCQPIRRLHPAARNDLPLSGMRYEILVRMKDVKSGNIIPPGAFLPAAERFHLASRIDHWVAEHTFAWLSAHPQIQQAGNVFNINLSGQSLGDRRFLTRLTEMISSYELIPQTIGFEITETSAIADLNSARSFMENARSMGCRLALDDFGSGLSSFGYLQALPVELVKIDGTFVKNLDKDPVQRTIVRSITEIGHAMGKEIVAEWVEHQAILDLLREMKVDMVQGYLLGKPVPIDTLLEQAPRAGSARRRS
ncbi:MAG: EAL domain-containing protein [Gammaproteobacteria bacterium]|nr:EAL domain-containing protein [Gammaproteobacteria bacterium]